MFLGDEKEEAKKAAQYVPSDGLREFLERSKGSEGKILYVGFGSIVMSQAEASHVTSVIYSMLERIPDLYIIISKVFDPIPFLDQSINHISFYRDGPESVSLFPNSFNRPIWHVSM